MSAAPAVAPLPALERGYVTFGCLNNFCKTNRSTFELWARVLHAVPNSRFVLLCPVGETTRRVLGLFDDLRIDPKRITCVGRMPPARYLATYGSIDVCLDTLPYNGHTTSLDSFWMGVPVVTITGKSVVARAGYCYAMNLGLPELATAGPDEFVARAVEMAGDLPKLRDLRATLRERMAASPLMDAPRFARNLEAAYRAMWREWCGARLEQGTRV
jgi:predicted O-linked N-acetylglucosamine transferase (SPINDLY family)